MAFLPILFLTGIATQIFSATPSDIVFIVDQSTSMEVAFAYIPPTAGPAPPDTLYYQDSLGCPSGTRPAGSNTNGTVQVGSKLVYLLKSNAGCSDPSGDPFGIRASAVNQAAILVSQTAQSSTLGYLPFANTVLPGSQRPVPATPANVAPNGPFGLNGGKLTLQFVGGTNYNRPMDSAVRWLKNPSLAPNSKHAIIFISDGRTSPIDSDGTRFLDATIPIHGIFFGKLATPDTAKLKALCSLTGGVFRRISPNQPDSVIAAVNSMVTLIIGAPTSIRPMHPTSSKPRGSTEEILFVDLRGRIYSQRNLVLPSGMASGYLPSKQAAQ